MKNPEFKTIFSSIVKPVISIERDKYLAKASLDQLKNFIPQINDKNVDLLPIATSSYVVNHVNKNGAVVRTAEALASIDLFINKPINVEHQRTQNVGVILTVGFSEFGTEKPLTREEVAEMTSPFNVVVGGVIWRVVSEELADFIEDTNDPTSDNYLKASASFEMGFDAYDIVKLPKGSKLLEEGSIVESAEEKASLIPHLKNFGGSGQLDHDTDVAILIKGNVLPMGIAITTAPAAAVEGVAVPNENKEATDELNEENANSNQINNDTQEKISQLDNSNVKENKNNNINIISMKINSIKDITDELLASQQIKASSIVEALENDLKAGSEIWEKEKVEKETAIRAAEEKYNVLQANFETLSKEFTQVKTDLETLRQEKASKEAMEKFNLRMSAFDTKYELNDADRKVIASQIKNLDDAAFTQYEENMGVLLAAKVKTVKEIKASVETPDAPETVIEGAIDTAQKKTPEPITTTEITPKSIKDEYAQAFSEENIVIQTKYSRNK